MLLFASIDRAILENRSSDQAAVQVYANQRVSRQRIVSPHKPRRRRRP
jgi:hypothetical protein